MKVHRDFFTCLPCGLQMGGIVLLRRPPPNALRPLAVCFSGDCSECFWGERPTGGAGGSCRQKNYTTSAVLMV